MLGHVCSGIEGTVVWVDAFGTRQPVGARALQLGDLSPGSLCLHRCFSLRRGMHGGCQSLSRVPAIG